MQHPPFCPNPACRFHHRRAPASQFLSAGSYTTRAFGQVRRFRCSTCGRYCSTQTFSIDYYGKRLLSYSHLHRALISTAGIRDIAREFHLSTSVVLNKISRLTRNCLAALSRLSEQLPLSEDLAADGFESFTVSQYFPCHLNLLVGSRSQLVYWFDYVSLRRKGRMSDEQKRIRSELEKRFRADPKGLYRSFSELCLQTAHLICDGEVAAVRLFTDEHPTYTRALDRSLSIGALAEQGRFSHTRIPSGALRNGRNPLFPVNYLDRQLRKDMAEHVRETVCFGRNVANAVGRAAVYLVYHNLQKAYRESKGDRRSHAEVAGLTRESVKKLLRGLYTRRAFASKLRLSGSLERMWMRGYRTPLARRGEYLPAFALAGI